MAIKQQKWGSFNGSLSISGSPLCFQLELTLKITDLMKFLQEKVAK